MSLPDKEFTQEYYDEKYFADLVGKSFRRPNGTIEHWGYRNSQGEFSGAKEIADAWKTMFNPKNLLDVGCGRGTFLTYARDVGIEAEGFDFSEWAIKNRYDRCKPEWLRVHDATKPWPYTDKSFELVVALDFWEHIYQEDLQLVMEEMFRVAEKWVFLQIAVAGCLTKDAVIFTESGIKHIDQLHVGDSVLSMDLETKSLQLKRVNAVIDRGEQTVYKVTVAGREIEATVNHPFLLLEHKARKFTERWVPLGELKVDNLIAIIKRSGLEGVSHLLPSIETHARRLKIPNNSSVDLLYLLGLYTGDGNYRIRNNKLKNGAFALHGELKLAIPHGDPARYRAIEVLEKLFHYSPRLDHHGVYMDVLSVAELIRDLGFIIGAYEKHIPDWIFGVPKEQKIAFIKGYVDSDGMQVDGRWIIYSVNRKLLEQTTLLAISAGINTSGVFSHKGGLATFPDGHITDSKGYFYVELYPNGQRTYSSAKGKLCFKSHTNDAIGFSRIKKIEPQGVKRVYDITVEGNENFVANGILVHNSGGLQGRSDKGYAFTKDQKVPVEFEGCAVAGHVTVQPESFWYEKFERDDWMVRRDLVQWFAALVNPAIIKNWLLNLIVVFERI